MKNDRKHYTAAEKVAVLKRHLLDKVPVSQLCEETGLQRTVFYRWQKEFFENGAAAFESKERPARQVAEKQKRIEANEQVCAFLFPREMEKTFSTAVGCNPCLQCSTNPPSRFAGCP